MSIAPMFTGNPTGWLSELLAYRDEIQFSIEELKIKLTKN